MASRVETEFRKAGYKDGYKGNNFKHSIETMRLPPVKTDEDEDDAEFGYTTGYEDGRKDKQAGKKLAKK